MAYNQEISFNSRSVPSMTDISLDCRSAAGLGWSWLSDQWFCSWLLMRAIAVKVQARNLKVRTSIELIELKYSIKLKSTWTGMLVVHVCIWQHVFICLGQ